MRKKSHREIFKAITQKIQTISLVGLLMMSVHGMHSSQSALEIRPMKCGVDCTLLEYIRSKKALKSHPMNSEELVRVDKMLEQRQQETVFITQPSRQINAVPIERSQNKPIRLVPQAPCLISVAPLVPTAPVPPRRQASRRAAQNNHAILYMREHMLACEECGDPFEREIDLQKHVDEEHPVQQPGSPVHDGMDEEQ